jgi:teichuronic acid biosynthesis glycosyltransferase TuaC
VAAVSPDLAREVPGAGQRRRVAVLPCGVDLDRFTPIPRAEARERLNLPPDEPCLLFPAEPARAVKRFDRAQQAAGDTRLLTLGRVHPFEVPLYVNAANAVLVPSAHEGFGLAALEALACDVPVLATPVGVHPAALDGIAGTLCAPFDRAAWQAVLGPHLEASDPRVEGRDRAALWSARQMARRVLDAWGEVLRLPDEAPISGAVSA